MHWVKEMLGELLDAFLGPNHTKIQDGETKNATFEMSPNVNDPSIQIGIRSRQVIYVTIYERWWIPNWTRTVYHVQGYAPDSYKEQLDPRLFDQVTYPMLSSWLLMWTHYPHVYAINAYVDRVHQPQPLVKVSI